MCCDMRYLSVYFGVVRVVRVVCKECLGGILNEFRTFRFRFLNYVKFVVNAIDENLVFLVFVKMFCISFWFFYMYIWNIFWLVFNVVMFFVMFRGERVSRVFNVNILLFVEYVLVVVNLLCCGVYNVWLVVGDGKMYFVFVCFKNDVLSDMLLMLWYVDGWNFNLLNVVFVWCSVFLLFVLLFK